MTIYHVVKIDTNRMLYRPQLQLGFHAQIGKNDMQVDDNKTNYNRMIRRIEGGGDDNEYDYYYYHCNIV